MTTLPVARSDGDAEQDKVSAGRRLAEIVRSVMEALGRPAGFLKATIRAVGDNNFRVNVLTGPDAASARIAHSFFVTADTAGTVIASNPVIRKCH